jgi:hypothetical protein
MEFPSTGFGHDGGGVRERTGDELLGLPVRLHGIQVGRPVDLLLDREVPRLVGADVLCGDALHRFLPLAAAEVAGDEIAIRSGLVLLEEDGLAFYRSRTFALAALRGQPVQHAGKPAGILRDIVAASDSSLVAVVVETDRATSRLPFDETLRFAPESRSAA